MTNFWKNDPKVRVSIVWIIFILATTILLLIQLLTPLQIKENEAGIRYVEYPTEKRKKFLLDQMLFEKMANTVIFITPELTNAITTKEYLEYVRDSLLSDDRCWGKYSSDIYDGMNARKENLLGRIEDHKLYVKAIFTEEATIDALKRDYTGVVRKRLEFAISFAKKNSAYCQYFMIKKDTFDQDFETGMAIIMLDEKMKIVKARQATSPLDGYGRSCKSYRIEDLKFSDKNPLILKIHNITTLASTENSISELERILKETN